MLPSLNPRIRMIGVDNSYSVETASEGDKATGRVGMNFPGADLCELRAGYAQDLPIEDESQDRAFSCMVFDKFNDDPQFSGTIQALREVARVLREGGEARLVPVRRAELERHAEELSKYFDVEDAQMINYRYGRETDRYTYLRLRRKAMSRTDFAELKRKSQEWKDAHRRT